jgi:biotin synthase-like enzyme
MIFDNRARSSDTRMRSCKAVQKIQAAATIATATCCSPRNGVNMNHVANCAREITPEMGFEVCFQLGSS